MGKMPNAPIKYGYPVPVKATYGNTHLKHTLTYTCTHLQRGNVKTGKVMDTLYENNNTGGKGM